MVGLNVVERLGERKAARYYPILQGGDVLDKLRDYFQRHETLTNVAFR
jgi:hypothetical protein